MPIADWSIPFSLRSLLFSGTPLLLNTEVTNLGIYLVRPENCALRTTVRSTKEDLSQQDGSILHRRFLTGFEMEMQIALWESREKPACDDLAQTMMDVFLGYCRALKNAGDNVGRMSWTPAGQAQRMLEDIRLLQYPSESIGDGGATELNVVFDSQFPYTEDENQQSVAVPASITNAGNTDTYPVFRLNAPITGFTMTNTATSLQFVYDSSRLGASPVSSGYMEIDMFRGTVYLNGNGANLKAGVDIVNTDFFPLVSGVNPITISSGVGGIALVNNAWA